MIYPTGFLDEYGMISCNREPAFPAEHTENGLLFSVSYINAIRLNTGKICQKLDFPKLFEPCFIKGVLYRSPEPHPKPDSHDNYTACALGALLSNDTSIAKKLLWSLFSHFFYLNHLFLGLYIQIPILLFAVAFPWLRWILYPAMLLLAELQKPNMNDTSGIQLQLTIISIIDILYPNEGFYYRWMQKLDKVGSMKGAMTIYFGEKHPITRIWS